jgi:hypothetical protein
MATRLSAVELFLRGDVAGLIEALDADELDDPRANDARVALSLIGEQAVVPLLAEIARPAGARCSAGRTSFKCQRARIALAGMGACAVPYLLDAIRSGDAGLAEGAALCLETIEEGGVVLIDPTAPTGPVAVHYPDDVRSAFERKLGRPLFVRSLWRATS